MRRLVVLVLAVALAAGCSGDDATSDGGNDTGTTIVPTTVLTGDAAVLATADRACLETKNDLHDAAAGFYTPDQEPTPEQVQQFFREHVIPTLRQQVTDIGALALETTDLAPTLAAVTSRLDELETMVNEHPELVRSDGRAIYEAMTAAYSAVGLPHCASS